MQQKETDRQLAILVSHENEILELFLGALLTVD